jgi:pimeloyl-ACP methyl ester carboxylesterase
MFALWRRSAKLKAELLGLMVNDPNIPSQELKGIQARTLVIAGTNDMIKDEHTRLIAENIPDATLVILKGSHFIANQHPQEFNQAVMKFLQD